MGDAGGPAVQFWEGDTKIIAPARPDGRSDHEEACRRKPSDSAEPPAAARIAFLAPLPQLNRCRAVRRLCS
jgi:hypothetical protein